MNLSSLESSYLDDKNYSNKILNDEKSKEKVINVEFIQYYVKNDFISALINSQLFKLTPNNLSQLFLVPVLEEFNVLIGSDNLFKKVIQFIHIYYMFFYVVINACQSLVLL